MLKSYVVLFVEPEYPLEVFGFVCDAEDEDHAEEQALDAYPDANVVWVEEGTETAIAFEHYWETTP